ncbi:phage holin family protein [Cellulomonas sp. HZM]|uniref:phage holin family protein n=1 Tax=Cellulomonas sp. HZM TaxID=1454010 RepID=UPI0004938BE2|nr:phage holin family protein [Cellulomonas sp. HZM]
MTTQDTRSIGELFSEVAERTARLVRAEIDLAKAEISGRLQKLGTGGALIAAAAFFALYLLAAVIALAIIVLDLWLPLWAAALIVTGALLLLVVVLALVGLSMVKKGRTPVPTKAVASMKSDVEVVKEAVKR